MPSKTRNEMPSILPIQRKRSSAAVTRAGASVTRAPYRPASAARNSALRRARGPMRWWERFGATRLAPEPTEWTYVERGTAMFGIFKKKAPAPLVELSDDALELVHGGRQEYEPDGELGSNHCVHEFNARDAVVAVVGRGDTSTSKL